MKIYLDDIRNPPDDTWTLVRSYEEFVELINETTYEITEISFDHDLGMKDPMLPSGRGLAPTGMDAAKWFVDRCLDDHVLGNNLINVNVHSSNPDGAKNIASLFRSARKHEIFNDDLVVTP